MDQYPGSRTDKNHRRRSAFFIVAWRASLYGRLQCSIASGISTISGGTQQQSLDKPQGRLRRIFEVTVHELIFKPLDTNDGLSSLM